MEVEAEDEVVVAQVVAPQQPQVQLVQDVVPQQQQRHSALDREILRELASFEDLAVVFHLSQPGNVEATIRNGNAGYYLGRMLSLPPAFLFSIPNYFNVAERLMRSIPTDLQHLYLSQLFKLPGRAPENMEELRLDEACAQFQLDLLSRIAEINKQDPSNLINMHAYGPRLNYLVFVQFLKGHDQRSLYLQGRKNYFVEVFEQMIKFYPMVFDQELFDLVLEAGVRFEDVAHILAPLREHTREVIRLRLFAPAVESQDIQAVQDFFNPEDIFMNSIRAVDIPDEFDPIQAYDY